MYDTIIIGRDMSSLTAALFSVRQGLKTALVMEGAETVHQKAGYAFPSDPRPFTGMADGQLFFRHFGNVLPAPDILSLNRPMDPAFQVILPNHRIDFFKERERLIRDLVREFPEQEQEINRFYQAVSRAGSRIDRWIAEDEQGRYSGNSVWKRLGRLSAALACRSSLTVRGGKDNPFRRVVEAQIKFLSLLEMDGPGFPPAAAYLLSLPMRGLFSPKPGTAGLLKHLVGAFAAGGGVVMDRCSVIRVATEPGIAVDLECDGSSSKLRGEQMIVSAQWEKLELLLPVRKILPAPGRRAASLSPAAYPFCLHMGIHAKGLPERMAPHVVVVREGTGPVVNDDLIFLQTSLPGDTESAPEGRRAMSATVYLSDSPLSLSDQDLKDTAMRVIDGLEGFLPFLRDNIDYLRVDESIHLSRRYQEIASRKYRMRRGPLVGLKTLSPKTRIPNVWLTGGILRAGLGFEGEILAGMDAAQAAGQGRGSK